MSRDEKVDWHIPTAELRFVERLIQVDETVAKSQRVLQQLWRSPFDHPDEWRDVPLVKV